MSQQETDFAEFLRQIESGRFNDDVTIAMRDLVKTLRDQARVSGGKPKGALTVTIALKVNKNVIEVDSAHLVKKPKPVREGTIMYAGADGVLSTIDTQQGAFEFSPALAGSDLRTDVAPANSPVRMLG